MPVNRNVLHELDSIDARLARLEAHVGLVPRVARATPQPPPLPVMSASAMTPPPIPTAPPTESAEVPAATQPGLAAISTVQPEVDPRVHKFVTRPPLRPTPAPPTRMPKPRLEIEKLVGGRWYAVIGAIVVMIGVSLFFRLAYTEGWIGMLHPWVKVASGCVFGAALLGLGEWLRRKPDSANVLAAAATSAAGVGILYVSAYSMFRVYNLVPAWLGFGFLAAVAALGIAVAVRGRLVTVAIVSLVGGYLAPILVGSSAPSIVAFPAYLLVLLGTGLTISVLMAARDAKFTLVRTCVWWGTVILGSLWAASMENVAPLAILPWALIVWAAMHSELMLWASRRSTVDAPSTSVFEPSAWAAARPFAASFSTTAWCVVLGACAIRWYQALHLGTTDLVWLAPATGCVLTFVAGFVTGGHLRILRDPPRTAIEKLGASMLMQCGAALIATVALALDGWTVSVAWIAMAVAAALASRWLKLRSLHLYASLVMLIATGRLFWEQLAGVGGPALGSGPMLLSSFSMLMMLIAAGWAGLGVMSRHEALDSGRVLTTAQWVLATLAAACAAMYMPAWLSLVATVASGLVAAWVARVLRSRAPLVSAIAVVAVELARVYLFDYGRLTGGAMVAKFEIAGASLTWWSLMPVVIAAGLLAIQRFAATAAAASRHQSWFEAMSKFAGGLAVCVLASALASPHATAGGAAMGMALIALAVSVYAGFFERTGALGGAVLVSVSALVLWTAEWLLPDSRWSAATLLGSWLHPGLLQSVCVAAALIASARCLAKLRPGSITVRYAVVAWAAASVLMLASTSFDVARIAQVVSQVETSQRAAVSIWWGVLGFGLIVLGFARRLPQCRHSGLALLGLGVLKALIWDLAGVPQVWRIVSFVGLGLLMLGVSIAYARLGRMLEPAASDAEPETSSSQARSADT